MGIKHKLKPEIKEFIVLKKKEDISLSCRKLSKLVRDKFGFEVSKSTINALTKEEKLSYAVGRRKERLTYKGALVDNMGFYFLKATDILLGINVDVVDLLKKLLKRENYSSLIKKNEILLFSGQLGSWPTRSNAILPEVLFYLAGNLYSTKSIYLYLNKLRHISQINPEIINIFKSSLVEAQYVELDYSTQIIYLDARMKSIWNSQDIPDGSSITCGYTKGCVKRIFMDKSEPLVLLMAGNSGNNIQNVVKSLQTRELYRVNICDSSKRFLKTITFENKDPNFDFILGLNIDGFSETQKIEVLSRFEIVKSNFSWEDFFAAEVEVSWTQTVVEKGITARGVLVRNNPLGMNRLLIITNIPKSRFSAKEILLTFLERWPNFADVYPQTNIGNSYYFKNEEKPYLHNILLDRELSIEGLFNTWLNILHYSFQKYFLPLGWQTMEFEALKEMLYSHKGVISQKDKYIYLDFKFSKSDKFFKEIVYACNKINEFNLRDFSGKKIFFRASFS